MFTGLIEEIGIVKKIYIKGDSKIFEISTNSISSLLNIGDSISVNGACQTVVELDKNMFKVDCVAETLKKTNLGELKVGDKVNLETSLTLSKKIGGHLVLGHVDCVGTISNITKLSNSWLIEIAYHKEFSKYVVNVGSIAVNGVSLTIAQSKEDSLIVSIIPHTFENTNLKYLRRGSKVNLEFDIIGKYVEKILLANNNSKQIDWLKLLSS